MAHITHITHLKSICPLAGRTVVDIGAGDGVYSKQLHSEGAQVTAIDIDPEKVSNARSNLAPDINVMLGAAEDLPLGSNSQQLACLFFSLHHVPADLHAQAFDEVCRVLEPGGRLHVVEPYPYGTMFDVVRMVEDETDVRTKSHDVLNRLETDRRYRLLDKHDYVLTREYPTFDFFVDKIVRPDPDRSAAYEKVAAEMQTIYDRVVERFDGRQVLHQPCAAYHFEVSD